MNWQEQFDEKIGTLILNGNTLIAECQECKNEIKVSETDCKVKELWITPKIKQFISELLQQQSDKERVIYKKATGLAREQGYNSAKQELLKWAEEKVGENHDKLLVELIEKLK